MLGNSIKQRLLFRQGPIIEKPAYDNITPNEVKGKEAFNQDIDKKVKVFC